MPQPELESAFDAYLAHVQELQVSGDWSRFADLFTEDAVYRRHGYDDFVGREAIRVFVETSMSTFPGNHLVGIEVGWRIVGPPGRDEPARAALAPWHAQNQVVFEVRHVMRDPGDGSEHAATTISLLTYAGDGLWSRCVDLHHLRAYSEMVRGWTRAALAHHELDAHAG